MSTPDKKVETGWYWREHAPCCQSFRQKVKDTQNFWHLMLLFQHIYEEHRSEQDGYLG